jgi:hypothetical protein
MVLSHVRKLKKVWLKSEVVVSRVGRKVKVVAAVVVDQVVRVRATVDLIDQSFKNSFTRIKAPKRLLRGFFIFLESVSVGLLVGDCRRVALDELDLITFGSINECESPAAIGFHGGAVGKLNPD